MTFSLIREAPVNRLLVVQTLAGIAQWIDVFLLFSVPAFVWSLGPAEMSMVAACFGLPSLVLGPVIGAILDRTDAYRAMVFGALLACVMSVALSFATGFLAFAVLVMLKGVTNTVYWPASSIVTQKLVPASGRVPYFSGLSLLDQIAKVGIPLLAGLLALALPLQWMFLVSAGASLIVGAVLVFAPLRAPGANTTPGSRRDCTGLLRSMGEGLRTIPELPIELRLSVVTGVTLSFALALYDPHLPSFLALHAMDAKVYSLVLSATGAGAVFGAVVVRSCLSYATPSALLHGGLCLFVLAVAVAALVATARPVWLNAGTLAALWALNGMGYELFCIGSNVIMQSQCPPTILGRVSALVRSIKMLMVVAGPSVGAVLISRYKETTPLIAATGCGLVLIVVLTVFAWGRQLRA